MIAIVNVSKNPKSAGPHDYELRVNSEVIARFKHNREDSLATCLEKAAKAAEDAYWERFAKLADDFERRK